MPNALAKRVEVSEELKAIIGGGSHTRGSVTKHLWAYIKKNHLQCSDNKREIKPDAKLAKVVGSGRVDMFKMTALVSKHIRDGK